MTTFQFPKVQTGEWKRLNRATLPSTWLCTDGRRMHQLGSGRLVMLGGWSVAGGTGPFDYGAAGMKTLTNEVWYSDDEGETWTLSAKTSWEDTNRSTNATRFAPQHCALSCVYQGDVVVIGAEPDSPGGKNQEVWKSSNGTSWSKVTITGTAPPTNNRIRAMCGTLGDDIYIMGGYVNDTTPSQEVWKSSNGGASWTQLSDATWTAREMVLSPVEHNGLLYLIGGGQYEASTNEFNDIWTFNGSSWNQLKSNGHEYFLRSRFHNVISLQGRLWIFGGYNQNDIAGDLDRAVYSDDNGETWHELAGGSGMGPSHAQAVGKTSSRIILIQGSSQSDRTVYSFERTSSPVTQPEMTAILDQTPGVTTGTTTYISGSGFTGVTSVEGSSSFTVDNDAQIHVTFPPHAAGDVSVWVTHPTNGRSNAITITYA